MKEATGSSLLDGESSTSAAAFKRSGLAAGSFRTAHLHSAMLNKQTGKVVYFFCYSNFTMVPVAAVTGS